MPKRFLFVLATFLLSVLLYVDRICISTAKDGITRDLGLDDKQFGWALSAFALGYALCQTPTGLLADRFGPRRLLSGVVVLWSLFTGLTGTVRNLFTLIVVRFLFGAGEAGAYPGMARAVYSWMPMRERGVAQGINFSGSRLGAAFALPVVATLIQKLEWRLTFGLLMLIGFMWAVAWFLWFRDDPTEHPRISDDEKSLILATRQQAAEDDAAPALTAATLLRSWNLWCAMIQYFCSNFTFFFCLTWLYPHLKKTYNLEAAEAGWYASAPLVCGALGNIFAGWLVDLIYRRGHLKLSRQVPAMLGFALAAVWIDGQRRPRIRFRRGRLVVGGNLRRRHDTESFLVVLHRYRRQERGGGFGNNEYGGQHRQLCHRTGVPLSAGVDG